MSTDPQVARWRVLIVDDDEDNLGVAAEYLSFLGATVKTAMDGEQGLKALKAFDANLILLDLSMPNMDGWQMFEALEQDPDTQDIAVIALTAHAMSQDRDRVLETGFDGYITKPFLLPTLVEQIKDWLAKREASS